MRTLDFDALRERMVVDQIARRGITDAGVLRAMRVVPRHLFVLPEDAAHAYDDRALPIGFGQTISQPYMVAVMTEALAAQPSHRILEIGAGSGYQAAILGVLAREVISIERHAELAARARDALARAGIGTVTVLVGDGSLGWPDRAPYDGIIVTAGAPRVPEALRAQLAEAGRLVIPVGSTLHQDLLVIRRAGDRFEERVSEGCVFVPLIGEQGWTS